LSEKEAAEEHIILLKSATQMRRKTCTLFERAHKGLTKGSQESILINEKDEK